MCAVVMSEVLCVGNLERQLTSASDDLLPQFDLEQNADLLSVSSQNSFQIFSFYRAMHFSAKRGIAIACRLSVRPSVCLSVCNVGEL